MNFKQLSKKKIKYNLVFLFFLNFLLSTTIYAQSTPVEGKITDAAGLSLPGVNIQEKGTKNGTSTDFEGSFKINVTSNKAILVISYLGFQTQEVSVAGKSKVNVSLAEQSNSLNEVVVVGYGTVKKSDVTGTVSTISAATITERNTTNPLEAIQGSTAGVQISSTSGRAGDGYKIVIRGNNSLLSDTSGTNSTSVGSTPLFVVDGVPLDNIDFLNPQDIARMDVLKDASSAAIYGSRASNGVVIVTTKSGTTAKKGINVSFNTSYGTKTAARLPKFMNSQEWYAFNQSAFLSYPATSQTPQALATASTGNSPLLVKRYNEGFSYDWVDAILKPGATQNNYLNISGRGESGLSYNIGLGMQSDEGLIDNDSTDKYSFKLGLNHKINDKFSTGVNITVARIVSQLGSDLAMQDAFRLPTLLSPWAVDANGNDIVGQLTLQPGKITQPGNTTLILDRTGNVNPLMEIANSSQTERTWQTVGNVFFQYQMLKWLSFKTTFAAGIVNSVTGISNTANTNQGILVKGNSSSIRNYNNFNYTWDNQLDLKHTFNEVHDFSMLLLQSTYANTDENSYLYSSNQPFESGIYNVGSGSPSTYSFVAPTPETPYVKNELKSYAVRLNYAYKDKYLLTASNRWDGSSVLSKGNQWESFPSVALGWKISKESFLKNSSIISDLKLRASLGYTGNDNVNAYASQALLDQQTFYANGSNLVAGWQSKNLANKKLAWEKTREVNFGLDFGLLKNRISGSVDVYDRLSTNVINSRQLPYETGYARTFDNVGSVSNKGVEVSLTTKNIQLEKLKWETTFIFSKNINELVSINYQETSDIGNNLILGSELNPNFHYVYDGVWQESEATQAALFGAKPGNGKLKDLNGDNKIDANDKTVIGSSVPKWQGSFYSKLTFGQFDFNFSIITSQGQTVYSPFHRQFTDVTDRNRQRVKMDYFVPTNGAGVTPNASNNAPRPGPTAGGNGAGATYLETTNTGLVGYAFYRDASYVKVKNISLGYTLNSDLMQKLKISNLRIFINVLDPFVFTDFDGYDPEWAGAAIGINRPSSITTQLGLSVNF